MFINLRSFLTDKYLLNHRFYLRVSSATGFYGSLTNYLLVAINIIYFSKVYEGKKNVYLLSILTANQLTDHL